MTRICCSIVALCLVSTTAFAQVRPEADLCAVPPGAQPLLPAKLMTGMGVTNMPVTTSSEEARKFFNQGISQMHSFWFLESERSFLQAATLDPNMAMAYWGMSVSAAGDYRPAFQLIRDPSEGGRMAGPEATRAEPGDHSAQHQRRRAQPRDSRAREPPKRPCRSATRCRRASGSTSKPNGRAAIPDRRRADADHIAALRKLVAAHPGR